MLPSEPTIAVFPGAFDPVTNGHVDLIHRAAGLFDKLIVGVGHNPEKQVLFDAEERVAMLEAELRDLPEVQVRAYGGLTMEFVRSVGARVILRGIRDAIDLRTELLAANANLIVGGVETVFLMASDQHALTSSTLIKQIVELGGQGSKELTRLVPVEVYKRLLKKFPSKR
jgi:pantetheine-phosphate adenylyltransferase